MALRLSGLRFDAVCRPDKAFTPPSGMLVGIFTVGRIRRLRRHPACAVIAAQKGDP